MKIRKVESGAIMFTAQSAETWQLLDDAFGMLTGSTRFGEWEIVGGQSHNHFSREHPGYIEVVFKRYDR